MRSEWALVAAAVLAVGAPACGAERVDAPETAARGTQEKVAVDERDGITFRLDGARLRVEAPRGFGDDFADYSDLDLGAWGFFCRPRDAGAQPAHATLPFDPNARELEVELSHDVSDDVAYCYVEPGGGAAEGVGWFLTEDEVFPGEVMTADPTENERRAREATDCATFIEQAGIETSWPGPGQILAPGVAPTVDIRGYWLGPEVGRRRATFANAQVSTEWDELDAGRVLMHYAVAYQVPEDGCLSDFLPSFELGDAGFHPGRELLVLSIPARSHTALSYLNDREVMRRSDGKRVALANGEEATVYAGSALGLTVVTPTTFVTFQVNGGSMPRTEEILALLRPVGE